MPAKSPGVQQRGGGPEDPSTSCLGEAGSWDRRPGTGDLLKSEAESLAQGSSGYVFSSSRLVGDGLETSHCRRVLGLSAIVPSYIALGQTSKKLLLWKISNVCTSKEKCVCALITISFNTWHNHLSVFFHAYSNMFTCVLILFWKM